MATRPLERIAFIAGGIAFTTSVFTALGGIHLYIGDNASHCGGGLGRIAPVLGFYFTLAVALLAALVALIFTLLVAFIQKRWAWVVMLGVATAASALIATGSGSQLARMLVGSAVGFGCSRYYPQVTQSLIPLVVAGPTLACMSYTSLVTAFSRVRGLARHSG
jgi:lysylphosphatidylglycerol synthetase-like protein (DUF2156 family)